MSSVIKTPLPGTFYRRSSPDAAPYVEEGDSVTTGDVYSSADEDALHVEEAGESICIGPPRALDSYLNIDAIVQAALHSGADAVHPGYGFLAESAAFAHACREAGLTFVGPSADAIDAMGNKAAARQLAERADVPTIPGSDGVTSVAAALELADRIGYPVLVKAAAGG